MKPKLSRVGLYYHTASHQPQARTIPENSELIELVTDGRGWAEISGELIEVTPGALLWHTKGDQTICRCDMTNRYRCLAIQIDDPTSKTDKLHRQPRLSWWRNMEEVRHFSQETVQQFTSGNIPSSTLLEYIYARLRYEIALNEVSGKHESLPLPLQRALKYTDEHYGTPITLDDIATAAGWSIPHLHARFRQHLRESPHQYLIKRRMSAAKELLASTIHPVKQIAHDCGFNHPAGFCAQFKVHTGQTPVAYRRQQTQTRF